MTRIHPLIPDSFRVERQSNTLSVTWNVICDEPQTVKSVQALDGAPAYGSVCPIADWLRAVALDWKPVDAYTWQCTVQYSNTYGEDVSGGVSNPWNEAPSIRYVPGAEMVVEEKYWYADGRQKAILNPAGDPYDNPPQVPRYFTTIEITWNARRFDDRDVDEFKGTLNGNPVTIDRRGYPAGTLLLSELTPNPTNDGKRSYVSITAQIIYKSYGHNFRPLFLGWKARESAGGDPKPVYITPKGKYVLAPEGGSKAITTPVLLDAYGKLLGKDAEPMYGNYQYLTAKSWSALQIPGIRGVKPKRNGLW